MPIGFARVQQLLDRAIADWQQRTHQVPRLNRHHRDFGWTSKAQLLASQAFGRRLIQPELIGVGRGREANIVVALRTGIPGFQRMPIGGPFLTDSEIDEIATWVDEGAPD